MNGDGLNGDSNGDGDVDGDGSDGYGDHHHHHHHHCPDHGVRTEYLRNEYL